MNCSRVETLLTDYLDGTLDQPVQDAVAVHVSQCEPCSQLVADVSKLRVRLEGFPVAPVPEGFVERILTLTTGLPKERSLWQDLVMPTLRPFMTQRFALATLVLFVFLSLMVNLVGPPVAAVLNPQRLMESADRATLQATRYWATVQDYKTRVWQEAKLLGEDLYGRLDYYMVSTLLQSYSKSATSKEETTEPSPTPTDQRQSEERR